MQTDELIALWTDCVPRPGVGEYDLRSQLGICYAGISSEGTPSLVVPLDSGPLPRGRVLGKVRVRYQSSLDFEVEGKPPWSQAAAVVDCVDQRVLRTFCCLARDIASRFDDESTSGKDLAEAVKSWDDLLRQRGPLSESEELGLFGEICVICQSDRRDDMVAAWRGPAGDTLDFVGAGVALEVKTSTRRRVHRVGQAQAESTGGSIETYLASVWLANDPAGMTLGEKVAELLTGVADADAVQKKVLAVGYREEHRHAYERRFHFVDVCAYPMEAIPRVHSFDPEISDLRYTVDISRSTSLTQEQWSTVLTRLVRRNSSE